MYTSGVWTRNVHGCDSCNVCGRVAFEDSSRYKTQKNPVIDFRGRFPTPSLRPWWSVLRSLQSTEYSFKKGLLNHDPAVNPFQELCHVAKSKHRRGAIPFPQVGNWYSNFPGFRCDSSRKRYNNLSPNLFLKMFEAFCAVPTGSSISIGPFVCRAPPDQDVNRVQRTLFPPCIF